MARAKLLEVNSDYSYEYDPELFVERGLVALIGRKLGIRELIGRQSVREAERSFRPMLNDLIVKARDARDEGAWQRWTYGSHDRPRVFTPPFQEREDKDGRIGLARLHIALPDGVCSQPIIHTEVVFSSTDHPSGMDVKAGHHIMWSLGQDPMVDIPRPGPGRITPEHLAQKWLSAVDVIRDAHKEFC